MFAPAGVPNIDVVVESDGDRCTRGVSFFRLFASRTFLSSSSSSIIVSAFRVNLVSGFARSPGVLNESVTDVAALALFLRRLSSFASSLVLMLTK